MGNQFTILPIITKGGLATQRLAKFGPNRDRGCYSLSNLLSFPLGHGCNHGVEKPSCWG